MIPQIFHQIWLGNKKLPNIFKKYQKTWSDIHPNWKIKLWNETNITELDKFDAKVYEKLSNYSEKSDYLRFAIIFQFGGIYVDTDFECIKNIETILNNISCFFPLEKHDGRYGVSGSIFGAEKNHPFIKEILEGVRERIESHKSSPSHIKIGPLYIQDCLSKTYMKDITLIDSEKFFSYSFDDFKNQKKWRKCITNETFGVHHYAASWWNLKDRINFLIKGVIKKVFAYPRRNIQ